MTRVALVTIQRGRHAHLRRQREALSESTVQPVHVVVSMDDAPIALPGCDVIRQESGLGPLPLAAARNRGIEHAVREHGASLVVLLDVDCLPSPDLIDRYVGAHRRRPGHLLAGPVWYLPPGVPRVDPLPSARELAALSPHAARPAPPAGRLVDEPRVELFWSLSFAVAADTHAAIGGFDEGYRGYGGEDTDYAQRARRAGVGLTWVGGGDAYHQHHPVSSPPVEHLVDIVRNARRYRALWGEWPMAGWLAAFAQRGLVDWDRTGDRLEITAPLGASRT
jgi:hypothetical protein